MTDTPSGGPASERMQALLSRAVEEQVSEQRAASTVLAEIKDQLAALEATVRGAASDETVARLDGAVSTVVADQRTATTLLSQRLEGLTRRVEELSALGQDVAAQSAALDRVQGALLAFGSFPDALSALQREVSGLHDQLAPLADVQASLTDLSVRAGGGTEALRPQLAAVEARIAALGAIPDAERLRDSVVDALAVRLERLQLAADRSVVGPEALKSDLGDLRASLSAAVGDQLDPLRTSLAEMGGRLERLTERVGAVGGDAGAVPGLAADLATLSERVEALQGLGPQLERLSLDVRALRTDDSGTADSGALTALSQDLAALSAQVTAMPALPVDDLAAQVSARVADRLVETLAPRIADVVLTRVGAALVGQLAEAIAPQLAAQADETVRAATAASEARVLAHVDEGLVTLAETLLRRKAPARAVAKAAPRPEPEVLETTSVAEVMDALSAPGGAPGAAPGPVAEPAAPADRADRPAVTTAMAPAPAQAVPPPAAPPAAAPAGADAPSGVTPARASARRTAKKAAKTPAPSADKPGAAPAKAAAKAPAKAARRPAAKPAPKKAAPRPRPQPLLERTPDLDSRDSDLAPVRPAAARPTPPPPPPAAVPPPPPPAPVRRPEPEPPKRKAWWRPGG
ncbi:MAG TPA: hypothetical protein VM097_03270 [Mycobacteriales bacterium]|nr:hypothetical protein [Mycobacteriales bacterium]